MNLVIHRKFVAWLLFCLCGMIIHTAHADQVSHVDFNDWSWANHPLTGDDAPFAAARREIDAAVSSKADLKPLVASYKARADSDPKSAIDEFRWAYLTYLATHNTGSYDKVPLEAALLTPNQPYTYNYDRLMLMLTSGYPQERSIAEQLYKVDPGDAHVKMGLAGALVFSKDRDDNLRALKLAQEGEASSDHSFGSYFSLGFVAEFVADNLHDVNAYHVAIGAYDKYLKLAPPGDARRQIAINVEAYLKRDFATKPK